MLREAKIQSNFAEPYKKIGEQYLSERGFYLGSKHLRAKCLNMESAPGTAETVIHTLKGLNPKGKVLDFGCGQHQSHYLRALGLSIHSCDVLDFNIPNFTKLNPAEARLPFEDDSFEVTVISEVVEHVESPWEVLKEVCRVTSGQIIVSTPNTVSKKSREVFYKTGFLHWFAPGNWDYHISPVFPWQMELFCKRHNLKLVKTLGNTQAFGFGGPVLDTAESLIFLIEKP